MKFKMKKGLGGYLIFLALYFLASFFVIASSRSDDLITVFGDTLPFSAFTGVFSSLANVCLIFLVVFHGKIGFFTSLIILISQFPILISQFIRLHSLNTIPGIFTTLFTITAILLIYLRNRRIASYQEKEMDILKGRQRFSERLFEQTATALVNAIDAKDTYSHGHSLRVAEYSERIAKELGKSEEECREVYYAALLHDVGKIGIQNSIINKNGKLTEEEFNVIKQHPVIGNQILSSISEYPYLSIGAHHHHERYDGKGYPDRLKGEDIPEIARIISVADAYDAMSSNRSYRRAIPQQIVREEIVKGAGAQFDPEFAKIMQQLIDQDVEYRMQEKTAVSELAGKSEMICEEYKSEISDGIVVAPFITRIHLEAEKDMEKRGRGPALLLFDSLDARYHDEDRTRVKLNFSEYAEIWLDGTAETMDIRKIQKTIREHTSPSRRQKPPRNTAVFDIEAVKVKDHAMIRIDDGTKIIELIIAFRDSARYAYIGLTGEYCRIGNVRIQKEEQYQDESYIPRIAEPISYIKGKEGDIPNVQIDGYRQDASQPIPVKGRMKVEFHSMSLPTARLIWHVPYFVLYGSDDGKIGGENYREYALIRLDGENWEAEEVAENKLMINKKDSFSGWDEWKEKNKEGIDVAATIDRDGDVITLSTENLGIYLKSVTKILDGGQEIFLALTGDQVALTDIRIQTQDENK